MKFTQTFQVIQRNLLLYKFVYLLYNALSLLMLLAIGPSVCLPILQSVEFWKCHELHQSP